MAGDGTEIGIEFTTSGAQEAANDVERVAEAVDALNDDATVKVDAETEQAQREVLSFEEQLERLTDDGRELRIEFRAQTLRRQISTALRDIERLDDSDPEIELRTDDLERAQRELRELADLAEREYQIEVDADPQRNARRAASDVESLGTAAADTAQSGIGSLRGFTDELGETAQAAGTTGNALVDAGEAAQIFGSQLGVSEAVTGRIAATLGAAGVAVTVGAAAWSLLTGAQEENVEVSEELLQIQRDLADGKLDEAASALADEYDQLFTKAREYGIENRAIFQAIRGDSTLLNEALSDLAETSDGISLDFAEDWTGFTSEVAAARVEWLNTADALSLTENLTAELRQELELTFGPDTQNAVQDTRGEVGRFLDSVTDAGDAATDTATDVSRLGDELQQLRTDLQIQNSVLQAQQAFSAAFDRMNDDAVNNQIQVNNAKQAVIDFAEAAENVPESATTEVLALIDEGSFRVAEARMAVLTARETKIIDIYVPGVTPLPQEGSAGPNGGVGNIPDNIEGYGLATSTQTVNVYPAPELASADVAGASLRFARVNGNRQP